MVAAESRTRVRARSLFPAASEDRPIHTGSLQKASVEAEADRCAQEQAAASQKRLEVLELQNDWKHLQHSPTTSITTSITSSTAATAFFFFLACV